MEARQQGQAPSLKFQDDKIVALEHPCIIQNLDRAILSLGGQPNIEEFLDSSSSEQTTITATLRPEDKFARGVSSTLVRTNNLLLSVSLPKRTGRKRKRGSDEPFVLDPDWDRERGMPVDAKTLWNVLRDNPENYSIKPVALLPETHRFRSIPDLQYSSAGNSLMQNMRDTLLSNDFDKVKSFKLNREKGINPNQDIQPPPAIQFTRYPIPYGYKQNHAVKFIRDNGVLESVNISLAPKNVVHVIPFDATTVPFSSPVTLDPEESLESRVRECIARLRLALRTRPVMSRRVQMALIQPANEDVLKRCWAYLGYMFRSGPFKDVLIAFGVDPRSDPKYRIYQSVSIQIPDSNPSRTKWFGEEDVDGEQGPKESYIFDGAGVYVDGRVWQVCDVTDPQLKGYLDLAAVAKEFDPTTSGWFKNGTWALYRTVLKHKIINLVNGKSRDDTLYEPALTNWPDQLDKSTAKGAMPLNDTPLELTRIMSTARSRAFQALKLEQDEKVRQKSLRGEAMATDEPVEDRQNEAADPDGLTEAVQFSSESEDEAEMDSLNDEDMESEEQDDEVDNSELDDDDEAD